MGDSAASGSVVAVELYDTQLSFLDRVVESGERGATRGDVLRTVLFEHVKQRLVGAPPYVGGTPVPDVLEAGFPAYGARRLELVLEPVTGRAVPVHRGEVLRIEQAVGGTLRRLQRLQPARVQLAEPTLTGLLASTDSLALGLRTRPTGCCLGRWVYPIKRTLRRWDFRWW
jgi:hypothetical protein